MITNIALIAYLKAYGGCIVRIVIDAFIQNDR